MLLLHCVLVILAAVRVTGRSLPDDPYLDARHERLFARDKAPAKCRLELFREYFDSIEPGGNPEKRNLRHHGNATLEPRMRLPQNPNNPDSVEAYMMSETSGQGGRTVESRLLHWQNKVGSDVNTAEGKPFGKRKSPLGVHVVGLAGCTALLIVSKKGFYMAHYWENIAFNLDEGMIPEVFESQEEAFQETVLDGLKEGFKGWPARGTKAEQVSLTELANDIDDPDIHAFLVIPATGQSTDEAEGEPDPYRTYWDRIKDEVGKIITRLDPNTPAGLARWTEYPYAPVQKSEEVPGQIQLLFRSTRGRVLFKYDPKHRRADGTRTKKTLVIIENEIKQEASWEW